MLLTTYHKKSTLALAVCFFLLSLVVAGNASASPSPERHDGLHHQILLKSRFSSARRRDDTKVLVDTRVIKSMEMLLDHLLEEAVEDKIGKEDSSTDELLTFSKALPVGNLFEIVKPWTLLARDQQEVVFNEIARMNANNVSGAVVECGVWAGGSSMIMLYSQIRSGSTDRNFWLYDTYEGHVAPDVAKDGERDYNEWNSVVNEEAEFVVGTFLLSIDRKCVVFFFLKNIKGSQGERARWFNCQSGAGTYLTFSTKKEGSTCLRRRRRHRGRRIAVSFAIYSYCLRARRPLTTPSSFFFPHTPQMGIRSLGPCS